MTTLQLLRVTAVAVFVFLMIVGHTVARTLRVPVSARSRREAVARAREQFPNGAVLSASKDPSPLPHLSTSWTVTMKIPHVSNFGTKWPTLAEVVTFSDETGPWKLAGPDHSIHEYLEEPEKAVIMSRAPLIFSGQFDRIHWDYSAPMFMFLSDKTFFVRFTFSGTRVRRNRFEVTTEEVIVAKEEYLRRGSWTLTTETVPDTLAKALLGTGATAATGKIHVLALAFEGNNNPTEFETRRELPINGTVRLFLNESRRSGNRPYTTLTHLVWHCIMPKGVKVGAFVFLTREIEVVRNTKWVNAQRTPRATLLEEKDVPVGFPRTANEALTVRFVRPGDE